MKFSASQTPKHRFIHSWSLPGVLLLISLTIYLIFLSFENKALTLALRVLPNEPDKSIGFYRDLLYLAFNEMLWYTGFCLMAWIVWNALSPTQLLKISASPQWLKPGYATPIILVSFFITVAVSYYTLDTFPNSSDEYVYVFQGQTMSEMHLTEKAHPLPQFFHFNHIAQKDGVRVGRFPPGWPIFLAAAFYAGVPVFLVNPILGLITLVVFYRFARKVYNHQIALWSLLILALSSYFIFTSASFFSHTSCMLMMLLFVYCVYTYQERQSVIFIVLAGFFIGMVVTIRYYTAVLIFIPFLITFIDRYRLKVIPLFIWMAVGGAPCVVLLLVYNHSITGNYLLPVTMWAYSDEALGFVRGHSFVKGVEHVIRWGLMFFYWCSPAGLILYVIYLFRKLRNAKDRLVHPEDYAFALLVIGYFFYYEIGGNQYGPRFLFEALPFLILFIVRNVVERKQKWAMALLISGLLYAVVKLPVIAQRERKIIVDRQDPYHLAESRKLSNAVVLISSRVCLIRPMPIGDLTRNDSQFRNDVLYAFDIPERNHELFNFYAGRDFYRYVRHPEEERGELIKIDVKNE